MRVGRAGETHFPGLRGSMKMTSTTAKRPSESLEDDSFSGRKFITALARGLDVLSAFRVGDPPLGNQELARRCQLPKPTISRITHTLTELGYLSYHEGFGCYELSGSVLAIGHVAQASFEALTEARQIMNELAIFSNGNVGIGIRDRLNMVYIAVCKAPSGIGLRFEAGSRMPITKTAMGRAYLAAIDQKDRQALQSRLLKRSPNEAEMVEDAIESAIAEYATKGFCSSAGQWHENVNGIAAPIPLVSISDIMVLNCGAPAMLMPTERMLDDIGPRLAEAAKAIADIIEASNTRSHTHERDSQAG